MIVKITIENCFSFNEPTSLNMFSTDGDGRNAVVLDCIENPINRSAIIFGANGAGKTNFITAMQIFYCKLFDKMEQLFKNPTTVSLGFFGDSKPSKFIIDFVAEDNVFTYILSFDNHKIYYEALLDTNENCIFSRKFLEQQGNKTIYDYNIPHPELLFDQEELTIKDSLLLKYRTLANSDKTFFHVASSNGCYKLDSILKTLKLLQISSRRHVYANNNIQNIRIELTQLLLEQNGFFTNSEKQYELMQFLQGIGVSFDNLAHNSNKTLVAVYANKNVNLPFFEYESSGTIEALIHFARIYEAIKNNHILIVDELDMHLHHLVQEKIIQAFHDSTSKSQIIFTSHNPLLINDKIFKRDQINFIKRYNHASEIYALTDIKNQEDLQHIAYQYLGGVFDAIPNNIDHIVF